MIAFRFDSHRRRSLPQHAQEALALVSAHVIRMDTRGQPRSPEEALGRVRARAECGGELDGRAAVRGMAAAALGDDPCTLHRFGSGLLGCYLGSGPTF